MLDSLKIDWKRTLKNTLLVIVGTLVLAFGVGVFVVPFELVTGGVTGLSIVLKKMLDEVELLSGIDISIYVAVINWALFFMGLVCLGKSFAAKTIVSTIVYPIGLFFVEELVSAVDFLNLAGSEIYSGYGSSTILIAAVFGGAAIGAGCALTFLGGGSTGGLDIVALALCKRFKKLKSSVMVFVLDGSVIVLGLFVNNLFVTLLGIIAALICAVAIDKLFVGELGAFVAHIVSDKYAEINDAVIERMSRTTTILDAVGGYSGENKKMVMVTFSYSQYADFMALISSIDENAFVTRHRAHEINGEGWTWGIHEIGNRKNPVPHSEDSDA